MQLETAHKAILTCHFEPPLFSNMGFSIWGENWCYKQSKGELFLDTGLHKSNAYAQIGWSMYIRAQGQEFNMLILHHPKGILMKTSGLFFPAEVYIQRTSESNLTKN